MRQFVCRSQDVPCPGIDRHCALKCFTIDPRNIAGRMVKTHLSVHPRDGIECVIDSAMQFCFAIASSGDLYKRAERGTGPPYSI
jgi:hypothetical protein